MHGLWDLVRKATAAGELELPREDILFFGTPHEGEVSVNSTRVTRVLGTDVWDWSCAEWRAAARCARSPRSCAATCPDSSSAYVAQSGVHTSACARRGASWATISSPPTTCSRRASSTT